MAGLRVQLFAARHPRWVKGVVLVDASTPEATDSKIGHSYWTAFAVVSRIAAWAARLGLIKPFQCTGDRIGLSGLARREKEWAYAHGPHGSVASAEVDNWVSSASQAKQAGAYNPRIPVAVVTAGDGPDGHPLKAMMSAPARAASQGYVKHVSGARHATLLGHRFADEIVQAVLFVRNAK